MQSNIGIIISREFSERVAKKSFIITTLLMPVLMLALMAAPALIAQFSTPSERVIAVSDASGLIYPQLQAQGSVPDYITIKESNVTADSLTLASNKEFDGVLVIGKNIVDNPSDVKLYLRDAGSMELETAFSSIIKQTVETERLKHYNIENLNEILAEIDADVHLQTIRVNETGESESTSSALSFFIGLAMTFILYMFLLIYGQMVMTSIIEEKNNRVLELVVSSVTPATYAWQNHRRRAGCRCAGDYMGRADMPYERLPSASADAGKPLAGSGTCRDRRPRCRLGQFRP